MSSPGLSKSKLWLAFCAGLAYIDLANDWGYDAIEIGHVLSVYMEATERGYVNGGGSLKWGDIDGMVETAREVAFREGSDYLPARFTTEPSTMPGSEGHVCELDLMLADYYEQRGWVSGVVPEAKLKELDIL